jgi:beta-glucosidase
VDGVTVSVDVTNTGAVAGKEIVQVYVHDRKSSLVRPVKELKGFAKVRTAARRDKTVHPARFPRLRLLSPGLPAVDHRGRRVRPPDRRVGSRHPLPR